MPPSPIARRSTAQASPHRADERGGPTSIYSQAVTPGRLRSRRPLCAVRGGVQQDRGWHHEFHNEGARRSSRAASCTTPRGILTEDLKRPVQGRRTVWPARSSFPGHDRRRMDEQQFTFVRAMALSAQPPTGIIGPGNSMLGTCPHGLAIWSMSRVALRNAMLRHRRAGMSSMLARAEVSIVGGRVDSSAERKRRRSHGLDRFGIPGDCGPRHAYLDPFFTTTCMGRHHCRSAARSPDLGEGASSRSATAPLIITTRHSSRAVTARM